MQRSDLALRRHADGGQRARHALFKHLFQLVPGTAGLLADAAGDLADGVAESPADPGRLLFGTLLKRRAFLDQFGKYPAALFLRLGESAPSCENASCRGRVRALCGPS